MRKLLTLSLLFAASLVQASGGGAVTVDNKNVLVHVLQSKALASLISGHPILRGLEFRSVTMERTFEGGLRAFTLFLEYENYPTRANCTLEAYLTVKSPGATAELPVPTFSEVSCEE